MGISRKRFLAWIAATGGVGTVGTSEESLAAKRRSGAGQRILTKTATVAPTDTGRYLYLPFRIPSGVNRMEGRLTKAGDAELGFGIFDERGPGYESPGFRGIFGAERSEFFITGQRATRSFVPGRIRPGEWTVIIPVFQGRPTTVRVTLTLSFGKQNRLADISPEGGIVRPGPAWFKGELHCHTPESSDAWASGTSLTPAGWADKAREIGLDFVSLTDHNVSTQNTNLPADSAGAKALETGVAAGPVDVLLLAGEEMTNWFHGHATVTGISPGDHLDWRQRPLEVPLGPNEKRIQSFIADARRLGAYTSAAHPTAPLPGLTWQFFPDAELDPEGALTDGIEVWTGPFQPDDEATLKKWDDFLIRGWKVGGNGGSDTHGIKNDQGFAPGHPTNVVYAKSLSKKGVLEALKKGRIFVTRVPDGAELYLSATGPEGQRQIVGGTIYGGATDTATFSILVRRGEANDPDEALALTILRDGQPVRVAPVTGNEATVTFEQPIGGGGYIRVELRSAPDTDTGSPVASTGGLEALTNPIFLQVGEEPEGNEPVEAGPARNGRSS